jgi:hypothetical protein
MTAPTLIRTRHRNHDRRNRPTLAQVETAARFVDELAARRPVVVSADGRGGGWYVTAVDAEACTYGLWRHGESLTVGWSEVTE